MATSVSEVPITPTSERAPAPPRRFAGKLRRLYSASSAAGLTSCAARAAWAQAGRGSEPLPLPPASGRVHGAHHAIRLGGQHGNAGPIRIVGRLGEIWLSLTSGGWVRSGPWRDSLPVISIDGIHKVDGEATLLGHAYIFGVLHHAWLVQASNAPAQQLSVDDRTAGSTISTTSPVTRGPSRPSRSRVFRVDMRWLSRRA